MQHLVSLRRKDSLAFAIAAADIPRSRLENTYRVNILAMFTLAQLSAKQMLKQGSGNIINIGSIQAYQPTFGILDYASTKVSSKIESCTHIPALQDKDSQRNMSPFFHMQF